MFTVIVPTRGRPWNLADLLVAWELTTGLGSTRLHVVVDGEEGETLAGYQEVAANHAADWWTIEYAERRRLGGVLNAVAPRFAELGDVGFMGDDHRPRTKGWDRRVQEVLDGTPLSVVYGNDLHQGETLPTAVFMDGRIVTTLGYMVPPGLVHLYVDNFWKDLGERLGTLCYLPDVIIQHQHPHAGSSADDDGYREVNSRQRYREDGRRYRLYMAREFERAVRGLV